MSKEDTEWVEYTDNAVEAHGQSEEGTTHFTISVESTGGHRTSMHKRGSRNAIRAANPSRKSGRVPFFPRLRTDTTHDNPDKARNVVLRALFEGTKFGGQYALSILKTVSCLARWPIAFCLTGCLFMTMMGYMGKALGRAFEPLCTVPGISSMSICNPIHTTSTPKWADYSRSMDVQTQSFEQLLGNIAEGSALSLEIKKAEIATADLISCIRVSDLEVKDTLALSLSKFMKDARKAGRSLQKLTSKVGGAIDSIMAVNVYALQSIASARENELSPWSLRSIAHWADPTQQINNVVTRTFAEAMNVFSANLELLIMEVERNVHHLNNLEEQLATLHEIIAHEDSSISCAKFNLLEDLWTKFGGNRKTLRSYEYHLLLLKGWGAYRKQALTHVVAALHILHAMHEDMEDMRERVAAPNLMGATIPVEVHMESMQMGLKRLQEGRIRANQLEEHKAMNSIAS